MQTSNNAKVNGFDRNHLIDLAFSIMEDGADEMHAVEDITYLLTSIKETPEDLESLRVDLWQKLDAASREFISDARLRQAKMDYLASQCPEWNYKKRCRLKHCAVAAKQMLEEYIANPTDEARDLVGRSFEKFFRVLSQALSMDVVECGRCLNDQLNGRDATPQSE